MDFGANAQVTIARDFFDFAAVISKSAEKSGQTRLAHTPPLHHIAPCFSCVQFAPHSSFMHIAHTLTSWRSLSLPGGTRHCTHRASREREGCHLHQFALLVVIPCWVELVVLSNHTLDCEETWHGTRVPLMCRLHTTISRSGQLWQHPSSLPVSGQLFA
jgi:hypothetical protein